MNNKVLILKNDRTGDLFVSLNAINKIIDKHYNEDINIFLSDINHKFSFLFPMVKKKIFSMNLSIIEKVRIFIYLIFNNVKNVYLPFFFRKIKFYGITIKSTRSRPGSFLSKYLYKSVVLDRLNIKKRKSSYVIQENLIEGKTNRIYLNKRVDIFFI